MMSGSSWNWLWEWNLVGALEHESKEGSEGCDQEVLG
jgi:hypothetical protein